YLWMFNTEDPGQDIIFWQAVPNSNSPNFAPGPVYETTYFTRCVRRDNCPWVESNILTVEVGDDAVAEVSGPTVVCVGEEAIFQAVNPGNGASISWDFTGSSTVESATGPIVSTVWQTFGSFSVTLTVSANGCTSTQVFNVAVVNNPNRCGGNLTAQGGIDNLQAREVTIQWEVPADGTSYNFELERSTDGVNFTSIAEVAVPAFVAGNDMAMYRQEDVSPLAGRTFYRVRMLDPDYGDLLSNVVELQLADGAVSALGRIFPNPARNGMIHVEMTEAATAEGDVSVLLYDVRGNMVAPAAYLQPNTGVINLPTANLTAGVYFIRMTVGDQTETHRVIVD
ncbi:MAG: T9SS type A sorting domain-containing protein, partial [Bacteroidota bacterium]